MPRTASFKGMKMVVGSYKSDDNMPLKNLNLDNDLESDLYDAWF